MKAINNKLSGTLTLGDYTVALSGTSDDVAAALSGSFAAQYTGAVSLSDTHTLADLKTINNQTNNTITLTSYGEALTGSTADVKAALDGTFASGHSDTLSDLIPW